MQYQCLAVQNTMAALIDGNTLHHWGGIPINAAVAADKVTTKSGSGDVDDLFERALSMRWLILDEVSSVSAVLLGLLDQYLRRACSRHPHARRRDGSRRPLGGINTVFAGDWW